MEAATLELLAVDELVVDELVVDVVPHPTNPKASVEHIAKTNILFFIMIPFPISIPGNYTMRGDKEYIQKLTMRFVHSAQKKGKKDGIIH